MADTPQASGGRKFLIAAGTSEYRHIEDAALPSVPRDLDSISGCFERLGYQRVLADCSLNQSASRFRAALAEWFTADDLTALDKVIFYYSGHGEKEDRFYLLFTDSRWKRLDDTAISAEDLVRIMLKHSRIQQALVVIDTCYSGEAILDATTMAGALSRDWDTSADCGIFFLAACRPKEFAFEGHFAPNLADILLNHDGRAGGRTVEYLDPGGVVEIVRQRLKHQQHVNWSAVGASGVPRLLVNPRFDPRARPGVDLESQRTPAPAGAAVEAQHGVRFFTGREAALRTITEWLRNPADARACVITGRPGTGKSTLLARLAADSGTAMRSLSARGSTLAGIAEEIARAFGFDGVAGQAERATGAEVRKAAGLLISAFAGQVQPTWIAIDGLDEAVEPKKIARELLTGLAALPHARVLVASRPEMRPDKAGPRVPSLGSALEIDLDQAEYADPAAVHRYAERIVGEAPAYRGRPELAHETASAIARKSGNVFLIARILSRTVAEAPEPLPPEALETLSDRAGPAFDEYLDRFDTTPPGGLDKRSVVDLLEPLAWAEGEGLPWEHIWAPLARAISGRDHSDSDIRVLIESAGAFVIESRSHGHSVYRLYHSLLAEHLRDASRTADIHRRIAHALGELTPGWTLAHPYVRSWLSIHAAKGQVLGRFVEDPLFLACAEPAALARAAALASGTLSPLLARLCSSVVFDLHSVHTTEDALSYLELHARQSGASELASRITALHVKRRWSVPWARWNAPAAHRLLARLSGFVNVAASEINGVPTLVTSSGDGVHTIDLHTNELRELRAKTGPRDMGGCVAAAGPPERPLAAVSRGNKIEVWNLRAGSLITELAAETEKAARAVHIHAAERTLVVAGTSSGAVYIWDLEQGTAPICTVDAHSKDVMAVIAARLGDRDVVASGSKDGTVLVWDIAAGRPIARLSHPERLHAERWVFSLAVAKRSGREVILAGYFGGDIIAWDPLTGEQVGEPLESERKGDFAIHGIAPGEIDGRSAVVSAESDGAVRVRDLESGEALRQPMKGHEPHNAAWSLALVHETGTTMAISGGSDGTVRAWDLSAGHVTGQATSETPIYAALSIVKRRGKPAILGVTDTFVDGTVHVLDAETGAVIGQPFPLYDDWMQRSAAATQIRGRTLVAFGSYKGFVGALDVATGKSAGGAWRCSGSTRVAFSELNRRPVLAAADEASAIHLFDFLKGGTLWTIDGAHGKKMIWAIGAGTLEGRPVILSSGFDGMLRVWDVETRAQAAAVSMGELRVEAMTLARLSGVSRLVFGTQHGSLHITNLDGKTQAVIHVGSQVKSVAVAPESTIIVATTRGLLSIRWHAS